MKRAISLASTAFFSSLLAFIFIYVMVFNAINRVPDENTVKMYITASYVDKKAIRDEIIDGTNIEAVLINYTNENDEYYSSSFETQGLLNSDILIIPINIFDLSGALNSFVEITDEMFNNSSINKDEYNLLIKDEKVYGIIVYQKDSVDIFGKDIEFYNKDETYVIAINSASKITDKAIKSMFDLIKKGA